MKMMTRVMAIILTAMMAASVLAGCAAQNTATATPDELYFSVQKVRESPKWVTDLEATKDAEQLIVVAGVDKTTAYVTMHEKDGDGKWQQIIATPGFIGKDGLGNANINDTYTPVGTFTIDKAFGLADDPGCQMAYTKVDENYYWSGDARKGKHFNELVNIKDVPDLDTENSERIWATTRSARRRRALRSSSTASESTAPIRAAASACPRTS